MAKINKPNYQVLWASSGAITAPDDTKKQTGWVVEKPPHQYDNWLENRQDTAIAHILQHGVPEWDNVTEYRANASYINRSGIVYKCKQTHTNQDPSLDVTNVYWDRAFDIFGSSATVQSNLSAHIANYINGSGINAPNFRTSLGLGTAAVLDFDPNTKVNKTGDTMTGNLTLPIVVANTQIQVGSNGNGSSIVYFYDDNDNIYRPFYWNAVGNDWFCNDRFNLEQRVWHSGNDGAGSGLDADLLDGLQASQLARTDTAETFASNVTVQGKLQVGKDGTGNSIIEFYDDNSNVWRSFFWSNANNRWEAHDNGGTAYPVVTGVNFIEVSDILYGLIGSKGANGWQKLPGGLVLQWGVNTASISSGGTVGVTFPTAFPNACLHMQSTSRNAAASGSADIFMQIVSYSQGGATLYVQSNISATTGGFFWFAIGY